MRNTKLAPSPRLPSGNGHKVCVIRSPKVHSIWVVLFPSCCFHSNNSNTFHMLVTFNLTLFHMYTCGTCQAVALPVSGSFSGSLLQRCGGDISPFPGALAETRPLKYTSPAWFMPLLGKSMPLLGAQCVHGFIHSMPLLNTYYMLSDMPGTRIHKGMSLWASSLSRKMRISLILCSTPPHPVMMMESVHTGHGEGGLGPERKGIERERGCMFVRLLECAASRVCEMGVASQ